MEGHWIVDLERSDARLSARVLGLHVIHVVRIVLALVVITTHASHVGGAGNAGEAGSALEAVGLRVRLGSEV